MSTEQNDLFGGDAVVATTSASAGAPLADRCRARSLDEMVGQADVLGPNTFLYRAVAADQVPSLVLWGPPGCGKTTLAKVIAEHTEAAFHTLSAVLAGVKDIRQVVKTARLQRAQGRRTILFIDEIHRFNKSQQDALLPHVEDGTVTLIGATTENPSFALNAALLSRSRVVPLSPLSDAELVEVLHRGLKDPAFENMVGVSALNVRAGSAAGNRHETTPITGLDELLQAIAEVADGDARRALNLLEQAGEHARANGLALLPATLESVLQGAPLRYDRDGDAHYDTISAFIKSMRGSDPDASIYYAARMLEAGEDPRFILRRVLIFASEDIGNADPRALQIALTAMQAYERLGMPEGVHALAQAVTYCASAPKSNAAYLSYKAAREDALKYGSLEIPRHIRNAPTQLMKSLGNTAGYQYPHDFDGHFVQAQYLPDRLADCRYYEPSDEGLEKAIGDRLRRLWGR